MACRPCRKPTFPVLSLARLSWRQMYTRNAMLSAAASRSLTPSLSLSLSSIYFHAELFSLPRLLAPFLPSFHLRHSFVLLIFMSPTRNVAEGRIMARKEGRKEGRKKGRKERKREERTKVPRRQASALLMGKISIGHDDRRRRGARINLTRKLSGRSRSAR